MTTTQPRASRLARCAVMAAIAAACLCAPTTASAQSFFIALGGGAGIRIDDWPTQMRVEEDFGWHFHGRAPRGFLFALAFSQSFLGDAYLFTFAPRFGYDILVVGGRKVDFLLGPNGTFGFALGGCAMQPPGTNCDPDPFFHMTFNFDLKLLFGRRGRFGMYFRPAGFEFGIGGRRGGDNAWARYTPMIGVNFNF